MAGCLTESFNRPLNSIDYIDALEDPDEIRGGPNTSYDVYVQSQSDLIIKDSSLDPVWWLSEKQCSLRGVRKAFGTT